VNGRLRLAAPTELDRFGVLSSDRYNPKNLSGVNPSSSGHITDAMVEPDARKLIALAYELALRKVDRETEEIATTSRPTMAK
jgi:hypothetical protein